MTHDTLNLIDGGCRDCGRFFLDIVGHYTRQDIVVKWTDKPRSTCASLEKEVAHEWEHQSRRIKDNEHLKLFDGQLCRLVDCDSHNGRLNLTLGPTSFREFVGTNLRQGHQRYTHGAESMANPLGVSAVMTTVDNFIVLGKRSENVFHHAGRIHPIGGMVEPSGGETDPFGAMLNEAHQEAGIPAEDVTQCLCLGMVRDKQLVQPEMVFDIAVAAEAHTLRTRQRCAADAGEHTELVLMLDFPASVVTFMQKHSDELTPVAMACLLLHGLHRWGSGWFTSARGYLKSVI